MEDIGLSEVEIIEIITRHFELLHGEPIESVQLVHGRIGEHLGLVKFIKPNTPT